ANSWSLTSKPTSSSAVMTSPRRVRKRIVSRSRVRRATGPLRAGLRAGLPREVARHRAPRRAGQEPLEHAWEPLDGYADLLHGVAVADGDLAVAGLALGRVADRLHVHGHAVRGPHLVLAAIEPTDGGGAVVDRDPAAGQLVADRPGPGHDLLALLEEREHGDLHGRQLGMEAEHHPLLAADLLGVVGVGQEGEQAPVDAGG